MVAGDLPFPLVTVNESVRHWDATVAGAPLALATVCRAWPFKIWTVVVVAVDGPEMAKVLKSSLN